jgi:HK97 family phage portal protein
MGRFTNFLESRGWINGDEAERTGDAWWSNLISGGPKAGVSVNEKSALKITTVYACVRIISDTIASLPLHVYTRNDNTGGKDRSYKHPLYKVLHHQPNDEMTAYTYWGTVAGHLLTWGNSYSEIEFNGAGDVVALWPISPDRVRVERRGGKVLYDVDSNSKSGVTLPAEKVLHIHGLGFDGLTGYSPIQMAKEALAFAKATENYGATFFGNGAKPGGVLEMEGVLKDDAARTRLRDSWNDLHGGSERSHKVAILESGMKYKPISLPPNDAQFLDTRKWQKADIAQIYRVPLHMLNELSNATFSNIEHQGIEFVQHTIRPYLVNIEQEIQRKLISDDNVFAEWLVDGLLRGDAKSRNEALQIQRQNGIINANEWRSIENMNPQDGDQGNAYLVNSAMIGVDQALLPRDANPKGGDTNGDKGTKKPDDGKADDGEA